MSPIHRILIVIILIWSAFAEVSVAAEADRKVPAWADPAKYPIMAWDYVDDEPTLRSMAECGVNSVAFVPPKMLDLCQKYGVGAIVFDERISGPDFSKPFDSSLAKQNLPTLIKEVGSHPAVMGYHLKDEPHAGEYAELAKGIALVKEQAPGKWPYVNLLPGAGPAWDKYLEDFITTAAPTILSYDRYSVVGEDGSGDFHASFWSALAQARGVATKHNLPLWNIVLSSPHWGYRELTEADVRVQTWGSLVYGVRGLAFYKFCSKELPIINAPDLGNFRNGPLDPFGEPTPMWGWLRGMNRQVQNLAPYFLKLKSDDVYHTGQTIPARNHEPTERTLVNAMGMGEFVIGDFTHAEDGSRWVMIVNRNMKRSWNVTPTFNEPAPKSVSYVSPITGELKSFPGALYYLAPGQGVLLKLEK